VRPTWWVPRESGRRTRRFQRAKAAVTARRMTGPMPAPTPPDSRSATPLHGRERNDASRREGQGSNVKFCKGGHSVCTTDANLLGTVFIP